MKIETEFNKGDKVWYCEYPVSIKEGVVLNVYVKGEVISYEMEYIPGIGYREDVCASTREALKAKLIDNINKLFEG